MMQHPLLHSAPALEKLGHPHPPLPHAHRLNPHNDSSTSNNPTNHMAINESPATQRENTFGGSSNILQRNPTLTQRLLSNASNASCPNPSSNTSHSLTKSNPILGAPLTVNPQAPPILPPQPQPSNTKKSQAQVVNGANTAANNHLKCSKCKSRPKSGPGSSLCIRCKLQRDYGSPRGGFAARKKKPMTSHPVSSRQTSAVSTTPTPVTPPTAATQSVAATPPQSCSAPSSKKARPLSVPNNSQESNTHASKSSNKPATKRISLSLEGHKPRKISLTTLCSSSVIDLNETTFDHRLKLLLESEREDFQTEDLDGRILIEVKNEVITHGSLSENNSNFNTTSSHIALPAMLTQRSASGMGIHAVAAHSTQETPDHQNAAKPLSPSLEGNRTFNNVSMAGDALADVNCSGNSSTPELCSVNQQDKTPVSGADEYEGKPSKWVINARTVVNQYITYLESAFEILEASEADSKWLFIQNVFQKKSSIEQILCKLQKLSSILFPEEQQRITRISRTADHLFNSMLLRAVSEIAMMGVGVKDHSQSLSTSSNPSKQNQHLPQASPSHSHDGNIGIPNGKRSRCQSADNNLVPSSADAFAGKPEMQKCGGSPCVNMGVSSIVKSEIPDETMSLSSDAPPTVPHKPGFEFAPRINEQPTPPSAYIKEEMPSPGINSVSNPAQASPLPLPSPQSSVQIKQESMQHEENASSQSQHPFTNSYTHPSIGKSLKEEADEQITKILAQLQNADRSFDPFQPSVNPTPMSQEDSSELSASLADLANMHRQSQPSAPESLRTSASHHLPQPMSQTPPNMQIKQEQTDMGCLLTPPPSVPPSMITSPPTPMNNFCNNSILTPPSPNGSNLMPSQPLHNNNVISRPSESLPMSSMYSQHQPPHQMSINANIDQQQRSMAAPQLRNLLARPVSQTHCYSSNMGVMSGQKRWAVQNSSPLQKQQSPMIQQQTHQLQQQQLTPQQQQQLLHQRQLAANDSCANVTRNSQPQRSMIPSGTSGSVPPPPSQSYNQVFPTSNQRQHPVVANPSQMIVIQSIHQSQPQQQWSPFPTNPNTQQQQLQQQTQQQQQQAQQQLRHNVYMQQQQAQPQQQQPLFHQNMMIDSHPPSLSPSLPPSSPSFNYHQSPIASTSPSLPSSSPVPGHPLSSSPSLPVKQNINPHFANHNASMEVNSIPDMMTNQNLHQQRFTTSPHYINSGRDVNMGLGISPAGGVIPGGNMGVSMNQNNQQMPSNMMQMPQHNIHKPMQQQQPLQNHLMGSPPPPAASHPLSQHIHNNYSQRFIAQHLSNPSNR